MIRGFYWKLAYAVAAAAVFLLDQASKAWVTKNIRFNGEMQVIPGFLNFIYAQNPGVAFSMFDNFGESGRWVLSGIAIIAAFAVVFFFWKTPRTDDLMLGALALAFAGICGNVADRLRLGFVIDFIDVQFGNWHYSTFNVADSAIVVAAFLLIIDVFFRRKPAVAAEEQVKNVS